MHFGWLRAIRVWFKFDRCVKLTAICRSQVNKCSPIASVWCANDLSSVLTMEQKLRTGIQVVPVQRKIKPNHLLHLYIGVILRLQWGLFTWISSTCNSMTVVRRQSILFSAGCLQNFTKMKRVMNIFHITKLSWTVQYFSVILSTYLQNRLQVFLFFTLLCN